MRGDEQRVVRAFVSWLERGGWRVTTEVNFVDVYAERDGERLYGEVKGRTRAVGLDVDTLYGQLLRRMPEEASGARYAVVVPSEAVAAALRVPGWVRRRLRIEVFEVTEGPGPTHRPKRCRVIAWLRGETRSRHAAPRVTGTLGTDAQHEP